MVTSPGSTVPAPKAITVISPSLNPSTPSSGATRLTPRASKWSWRKALRPPASARQSRTTSFLATRVRRHCQPSNSSPSQSKHSPSACAPSPAKYLDDGRRRNHRLFSRPGRNRRVPHPCHPHPHRRRHPPHPASPPLHPPKAPLLQILPRRRRPPPLPRRASFLNAIFVVTKAFRTFFVCCMLRPSFLEQTAWILWPDMLHRVVARSLLDIYHSFYCQE